MGVVPPGRPAAVPAPDPSTSAPSTTRHPAVPRRVDSRELFGDGRLLEIAHAGAVYRLSLTALGKLILTK